MNAKVNDNKKKYLSILGLCSALAAAALAGADRRWSAHPVQPSVLGRPAALAELEALLALPGPVEVESIAAAEWAVPRSGLVNLDDARAKSAGLTDGPEPISIFFHALRHPSHGLFIVDTGIERAFVAEPERSSVRGLVRSVSGVDQIRVKVDLATWLSQNEQALSGVFLTHLHLDHILGLPDVPRGTPLYAGPGETTVSALLNLIVRPTVDRALAGHEPIGQWQFPMPAPAGTSTLSVLDIFADGSVWALHVPGHSPGSTAYLARTPNGPVLFTGDACHTVFGWQHGVEPGTFSLDQPASELSLHALENLVLRHPSIDVRLGHQVLPASPLRLAL